MALPNIKNVLFPHILIINYADLIVYNQINLTLFCLLVTVYPIAANIFFKSKILYLHDYNIILLYR